MSACGRDCASDNVKTRYYWGISGLNSNSYYSSMFQPMSAILGFFRGVGFPLETKKSVRSLIRAVGTVTGQRRDPTVLFP